MAKSKQHKKRSATQAQPPKPVAPAAPTWHSTFYRWACGLLPVIAFALYANTISRDYALDDKAVVTENRFTQQGLAGIKDLVTHDHFYGYNNAVTGLYRPLPLITHAVEWELLGPNPHASHFINILLYALLAVMIFVTLHWLLEKRQPVVAAIAALLFLVHPLHTELVANIKGRDEVLNLLLLLTAVFFIFKYARGGTTGQLAMGLVAYAAALFTKESALTFLAVIPLALWFFSKMPVKKIAPIAGLLLGVSIVYLFIHGPFVNSSSEYRFLDSYFQYATDRPDRLATGIGNLLNYLKLLVFPHPLVYDYSYNQTPLLSWAHPKPWVALLLVGALTGWAFYALKKRQVLAFCIFFFFITLSVASNIITPSSAIFAERFLFIPSLGFCLAVAVVAGRFMQLDQAKKPGHRLKSDFKTGLVTGVLALACLALGAKTVHRNTAWKDDLTLFTTDLKYTPNNARTHFNLGRLLALKAQESDPVDVELVKRSQTLLQQCLAIDPNFTNAWRMLAFDYEVLGDYAKAARSMKKFVALANSEGQPPPVVEQGWVDLGNLYRKVEKRDSVAFAFRQAAALNPQQFSHYLNIGNAYFNQQQYGKAIQEYFSGLKYNPNSYNLNYNIAAAYYYLNDKSSARRYAEQALQLQPENEQARSLLNLLQ